MAARLLALASGRIPRPALVVAWACLLLFVAAWTLLAPGHRSQPRLLPQDPSSLLLSSASPWLDRAELADPSGLFLRSPTGPSQVAVLAQPEATPFLAYGSDLRTQPSQPLNLNPLSQKTSPVTAVAVLLEPENQPLRTLGQAVPRQLPASRMPIAEVFSDSGELITRLESTSIGQSSEIHKLLSNNILSIKNPIELRLGTDNFGLQSQPYLTISSGNSALDQAALDWASRQAWGRLLPPGSYRIRVGP
jgi:hypothetical protein